MLGSTTSRGAWSSSDALHHISYLEMLAVHFALKAFRVYYEGTHVRVMIDCLTAFTTLEHMSRYKSLAISVMKTLVIHFVRHDEE